MYLAHFNLNQEPFSIAPDPSFLYLSDGHREALAHLHYGFAHGGFVMVTGEVGTGKTTLLRNLVKQTPEDLDVAFVLNPRLTVKELLQTVCDELGIPYDPDKNTSIKQYIDRLNAHLLRTHQQGRSTVLIIDEAQNLSPAVLEQIRLLTNLETDERKLLRIILLGQPELGEMLARQELRQLAQRITARYHLGALSREDCMAYISHRLTHAGGNPQLFTPKAMNALFRISKGIPRLINVVADRSLLGAYVKGESRVTHGIVDRAALEILPPQSKKPLYIAVGVFALLSAGIALAYLAGSRGATEPAGPSLAGEILRPVEQPVQAAPEPEPTAAPAPANPGFADISRPEGTSSYISQRQAYASVFARWGANYSNAANTQVPCNYAPAVDLQCLSRKGGWSDVERLNLPAVLELWDRQPEPYYGAIVAKDANGYILSIAGIERRVTPRDLRDAWFGNFVVLWQTPPRYPGNLRQDDRHSTVRWLREQMIRLTALPIESSDEQRFDSALADAVKLFQEQEGLVADGIVGPETWIRIHHRLGLDGPTLIG
jgi:general secretion pathway protein A